MMFFWIHACPPCGRWLNKPEKYTVSSMPPLEKRSRIREPRVLPGASVAFDSRIRCTLRFPKGFSSTCGIPFLGFLRKTSFGASGYLSGLTKGWSDKAREAVFGTKSLPNGNSNLFRLGQGFGADHGADLAGRDPCEASGLPEAAALRALRGARLTGDYLKAKEKLKNGDYAGALADLDGLIESARKALIPCFVAGTPLLTPEGSKPIEQFREGDLLLSVSFRQACMNHRG